MSHEEREHRSAPVLTVEQVTSRRAIADAEGSDGYVVLADSHEALRAERDAALAEVARLKAECEKARLALQDTLDSEGLGSNEFHALRLMRGILGKEADVQP